MTLDRDRPPVSSSQTGPSSGDAQPDRVSVLVIDDHEMVREGIARFLATRDRVTVVGAVGTAREGVRSAVRLRPDVILLDLALPDGDGVDLARQLSEMAPASKTLILTSYVDDDRVVPALRAGALGYLLKSVGPAELATAIERASQGIPTLHPHVTRRLVEDLRGDDTGPRPSVDDLTPREREVLASIAEGLANVDIAVRLGVTEATVKGHVSNILAKLQVEGRTQAAVFAWREGIVRRRMP